MTNRYRDFAADIATRRKSLTEARHVAFERLRDELEKKENSSPGGYTLDSFGRALRDVIEIDTLIMGCDMLCSCRWFNERIEDD